MTDGPWEGDDLRGRPVYGEPCPRCKHEAVVYNGTYFCTWESRRHNRCEWTMGDNHRPRRIIMSYLRQRYEDAKHAQDTTEMNRMAGFLEQYGVN